jgi:hypothetical protein
VVGEGDLRAQLEWTLDVIKRLLETEGATFRNFVAQTVYTTNIAELAKIADSVCRGTLTPPWLARCSCASACRCRCGVHRLLVLNPGMRGHEEPVAAEGEDRC